MRRSLKDAERAVLLVFEREDLNRAGIGIDDPIFRRACLGIGIHLLAVIPGDAAGRKDLDGEIGRANDTRAGDLLAIRVQDHKNVWLNDIALSQVYIERGKIHQT